MGIDLNALRSAEASRFLAIQSRELFPNYFGFPAHSVEIHDGRLTCFVAGTFLRGVCAAAAQAVVGVCGNGCRGPRKRSSALATLRRMTRPLPEAAAKAASFFGSETVRNKNQTIKTHHLNPAGWALAFATCSPFVNCLAKF